jgi:uncharacterized protein YkwD
VSGGVPLAVLIALVAAVPSASSTPRASKKGCNGVHLLSAPYLVTGLDGVVIDVSGPLDYPVICQPISVRSADRLPADAKRGCENSRVPAYKLRPKQASESARCLIDKIRGGRGLRGLSAQRNLKKAAKRHTSRMLDIGCFSHQCPGEPDLVGRVTQAGYLPCTCTWSVGENLAWGIGQRATPAAIVDAWMASPPHREMILMGGMRDIDIGVKSGAPGSGTGKAATYTADFGVKS